MSSSSSLSSAKRRRGVMPPPNQVVNTNSRLNVNGQQSQQKQQSSVSSKNVQFDDQNNVELNENESVFPLLPPPPNGLSIQQVLSTHHLYVNKMASDFSTAINELGNTLNMLSSNCDNLNERLDSIEKEKSTLDDRTMPVNVPVSNKVFNLNENNDFLSLKNDVKSFNDKLNAFDVEIKELKELKVLLIKNQGLILDNTLNITNMKAEYNNKLSDLEYSLGVLSNKIEKLDETKKDLTVNYKSEGSSTNKCVHLDEYVSNSLTNDLSKILLNNDDDNNDNNEEVNDNVYNLKNKEVENISLGI